MAKSGAEIPPDLRRRLEEAQVEFKMVEAREIINAIAEEMATLPLATFDRWPYLDPEVPPIDHLRWSLASMQGRIGGRLVYTSTAFAAWMRIGSGPRDRRQVRFTQPWGVPEAQTCRTPRPSRP